MLLLRTEGDGVRSVGKIVLRLLCLFVKIVLRLGCLFVKIVLRLLCLFVKIVLRLGCLLEMSAVFLSLLPDSS